MNPIPYPIGGGRKRGRARERPAGGPGAWATGRFAQRPSEPFRRLKEFGGGHSHARLLFAGGRVWVNGTTNPIGAIDLTQPGDQACWDLTYAKRPRPVGCTVTRATPNYVFGSLTTYSLNENAIQHTNAARSVCDVGATPGLGMTFITPTQCFCAPYLPGFKAFHPRPFAGEEPIARLESGSASPARKRLPTRFCAARCWVSCCAARTSTASPLGT